MKVITTIKNWAEGSSLNILRDIHKRDVNIAIFNRDINALRNETEFLLKHKIKLLERGDLNTILNVIDNQVLLSDCSLIVEDIKRLLYNFQEISRAKSFRFTLTTVNTNMCRRFHEDEVSLRLLCTYSGPSTLWLKENDVNRNALNSLADWIIT